MNGDFERAAALAAAHPDTAGIGGLQEKTLHRVIKFLIDENPAHHEVPLIGKIVADIYDGEQVYEIQNGNFSAFCKKLERLLPVYPVTVIYPYVREKQVVWIHPANGDTTPPRKSPKRGTVLDTLPELAFIKDLLFTDTLTVWLLPVDVIEYRTADGWSADGKRGSHRAERIPTAVGEVTAVTAPADIAAMFAGLPEVFTTADIKKITRRKGRRLSAILYLLKGSGLIQPVGKQGNAIQYKF